MTFYAKFRKTARITKKYLNQISHLLNTHWVEWLANKQLIMCTEGINKNILTIISVQSVTQSCPTLCDPMNHSMPGIPVYHQLPESTQTHVHRVGDAIQPFHPLSSPSPPAPNPSQHQGLFKWVNSSHEVAKVLEFRPQHQSFQRTPRTGLL